MTTDSVISARGVQVHFAGHRAAPVRAVDGIDLEIARGAFHGIVGESGCGKTTLARTLVGLQRASAGEVRVEGRSVHDWLHSGRRTQLAFTRQVQFIFQDPLASLSRRQTVFETLEEPLRIHGLGDAAQRRASVLALLELVSLPVSCGDRLPRALSGGQRQRVAIARALALAPRVLVCDEPLSALDVSIRAQLLNLFADLRAQLGLSIVLIAHDLAIVRLVCSTVSVMYLGQVVETGRAEALFAQPAHPYTRALLSAVPSTDPVAEASREHVVLQGDPPSPSAPPAGCRFHTRCPLAEPRCAVEPPRLRAMESGVQVACHLA